MSKSELNRREFLGVASGAAMVTPGTPFDRAQGSPERSRGPEIGRSGPIGDQTPPDRWFADVPAGRSIVRAGRAMVATSQPLAIMIDPATGMLSGASDCRKDGIALGY